jgi:hypothetical protein
LTASAAISAGPRAGALDATGERPRSFDPFRVLSREERREQLDAYLELLQRRDGVLDFPSRTLSRREEFIRALERDPVVRRGAIDRHAFYERFHRRSRPPIDRRTLWMLALAKTNESESYGAAGEVERYERSGLEGADPQEVYIVLEEQYHGRMLMEACRALDLELELQKPKPVMRFLIHLMQYLPRRIRYVPILCGEVLGCTVFRLLADMSDVLPDEPEVARRIRLLMDEIAVDEVFHVLYCRARIGPVALRAARALLPCVALGLLSGVPELRELGLTPRAVMRRLRREIEFPPELGWRVPERARS